MSNGLKPQLFGDNLAYITLVKKHITRTIGRRLEKLQNGAMNSKHSKENQPNILKNNEIVALASSCV